MCLAVPVQIIEVLPGDEAIAEIAGVKKTISTALIEDVILHVGYALQKIDPEEAQKTIQLFNSQVSA